MRGEPLDALSRELGVEVYRLERWKQKALAGLDAGLKEREGDPVQNQLDAALRRIGEFSMENELPHARIERPDPLAGRRSKRQSAAVSASTGGPYGVPRVCAAWGLARSTFYAAPPGSKAGVQGPGARGQRRGALRPDRR